MSNGGFFFAVQMITIKIPNNFTFSPLSLRWPTHRHLNTHQEHNTVGRASPQF
jgi:hypothetical protein